MSLRSNILIVSGLVLFGLVVTVGMLSQRMLLVSNDQLEERLVRQNVERARDAISMEIAALDRLAADWAGRRDLCEFARGGNAGLRAEHMSDDILRDLALNLVSIVDTNGTIVFGRMCESGGVSDLSPFFDHVLAETDSIVSSHQSPGGRAGLLADPGRWPMLIVVRPIMTGRKNGQSGGVVILGRYLDLVRQQSIVAAIRQQVDISIQGRGQLSIDCREAHAQMEVYGKQFVRTAHEGTVSGYEHLDDIYGNPAFMLRVSASRKVYQMGVAGIRRDTALFLVIGLVLACAVLWLIDRYVVSVFSDSVSRLSKDVAGIAAGASLAGRIEAKKNDEMGHLTVSINEMLRALESAQKEAEEHRQQLVQARKMAALGTLVSGVAHEVNNPNNVVALSATALSQLFEHIIPVLEERFRLDPDFHLGARRYGEVRMEIPLLLKDIKDASSRIGGLVDELKGFARSDAGDLPEQVDVNAVVKSAIGMVRHELETATDRFSVAYGTGLPHVKGNARRLEQIVVNLIQNAHQSLTERMQAVTVATRYEAGIGVMICVTDEGRGIAAADLPRVTEPFFTTRREKGGTGLGLAISSMIVENHGGTLKIESKPGSGTTATVVLPGDEEDGNTGKHSTR